MAYPPHGASDWLFEGVLEGGDEVSPSKLMFGGLWVARGARIEKRALISPLRHDRYAETE